MSLFFTTFSFVLGLYFLRCNVVLFVTISILYFGFLFYRFGKKKFILFVSFFIVGISVPLINVSHYGESYKGVVIEARDNYIILQSKLHRYYISSEDNSYEIGDVLYCEGKAEEVRFTTYESQFDFKEYLNNKGVNEELKVNKIDSKYSSPIKIHFLKKKILSNYDGNAATLISAFLFNDKDYSSDLIKHANDGGVIYLFSLSGTYLNIIFAALTYVLFIKFKKKTAKLLPFIILLPFAFFSFTKIGTIRVYSLYFLKYLNEFHFKKRKFSHIELVSILALFFLIIDHYLAYQEAFYIGFLLSVSSPLLHNAIKPFGKRKNKFLYMLLMRFLLIPIQISQGSLTLFILLKQAILLPISFGFFISLIINILIPSFSLCNKTADFMAWILEKMDLFNIRVPFGNWGGAITFILITVLLIAIYFLESLRFHHLKITCGILSLILVCSIAPLQEPIMNAVYFINVGQGDCILLKNRNYTVMIDTGGNKNTDLATESLIPFMNKKKITHINTLILTHDDFDHCGAMDSLLENFKVGEVVSETSSFPYTIGDLKITNLNTFSLSSDNDKSLVLYTNFISKSWLLMGDASTKVENQIIEKYPNLKCDILKVGHHGAKTSTSEKFIQHVRPSEAIISVGANNYYGHPSESVIDILEKSAVKIRRTDQEGTISYLSLLA